MGAVEEVVARIPGAVLAVDDNLRVQACSPATYAELHLTHTDILGRPCHEIVSLTDSETGRPCLEHCPLAHGSAGPGWVYDRLLELRAPGSEETHRVSCLLLKYVTQHGQPSNLCFLESNHAASMETPSRVMQAIETVYPAISGLTDLKETLALSLRAVVRATSAEGGEAFVLDRETREVAYSESHALPAETMQSIRQSLFGNGSLGVISQSRLPLLGVGRLPSDDSTGPSRLYLCAPLVAEGQVLGVVGITSQRREFDVGLAARVLFPVAAQLGVYLRWAHLAGEVGYVADHGIPHAQAARLQIHCLGPFRVVLETKSVAPSRFRRSKALTLLKFLAAHRGRPVPRETLMELLWPEADPARAGATLRVVLHALRRGLEPDLRTGEDSSFIVSQGDLVSLESSSRVWVDAEEFVERVRRAARLATQDRGGEALEECRRAASLYQGEYLDDESYSDWCLFERERLKEVYITLMKQMASILGKRGDVAPAIDAYRNALGADRGREEVHRELMLLLWRVGRRDEALRQFETCRRTLREELDVEPSRETNALHQAVVAGDHPRVFP